MQTKHDTHSTPIPCKAALNPKYFNNRAFWLRLEKLDNGIYLAQVDRALQTLPCINTFIKKANVKNYAICYPDLEELIAALKPLHILKLKEIILEACNESSQKKYVGRYFDSTQHQIIWLTPPEKLLIGRRLLPIWELTIHEKPLFDLAPFKKTPTPFTLGINVPLCLGIVSALSGFALLSVAFLLCHAASGGTFGVCMAATGLVATLSSLCFFKASLKITKPQPELLQKAEEFMELEFGKTSK